MAPGRDTARNPGGVDPKPGIGLPRILAELTTSYDLRGNLVPDAALAALAIEHGVSVVSTDTDFARFKSSAGKTHCSYRSRNAAGRHSGDDRSLLSDYLSSSSSPAAGVSPRSRSQCSNIGSVRRGRPPSWMTSALAMRLSSALPMLARLMPTAEAVSSP